MDNPNTRPTSLRLAIIADDLTGALDAAAPFAVRGLFTIVVSDFAELAPALAAGPDVVSVTTRSREVAPEEARCRVARVVDGLPAGARLFKKVDSRLKGNLEAELSAMPAGRLLVLPAIPEFGRIVRDGSISGFGVETPISVAGTLGSHIARAIIPDTTTQAEIAAALGLHAQGALAVGARGLAEALADTLSDSRLLLDLPAQTRATMVVGSRDPITLAQVDRLRLAHPDLCYIPAANGVAPAPGNGGPIPRLTLLQAVPGDAPATGGAVAAALAESLCRYFLDGRNMLVLTGGATAESVLARLGVERMTLMGEFLPGLPVSMAGGRVLLTKSGGFGETDALARIADRIRDRTGEWA